MISAKDIQSRVLIYAKPSATDVFPYAMQILPISLSAAQEKTIILRGKSFIYDIRNLYLSSSDISIFENLNYTYFNPFSANSKLYVKNPPFYGISISSFNIFNEKTLYFDIPNEIFYNMNNGPIPTSVFIDIIVENEAGYGLLSRDSYSYKVCSWSGFIQEQKPCISGIELYTKSPIFV